MTTRRAPRLRPDQLLADSITRVGRFARIDPRSGRELPSLWKVIGTMAWLGLVVESFRRARKDVRPAGDAQVPRPDLTTAAGDID